MSVTIKTVTDNTEVLKSRLKDMKNTFAAIGVLGSTGDQSKKGSQGSTVLDVALAHEFGAPEKKIPKRSFLRQGVRDGKEELKAISEVLVADIIENGADVSQAAGILGEAARGHVLDQFQTGGKPAWKQSKRAENEGGSTLVDTGQLMQSIQIQVREKNK